MPADDTIAKNFRASVLRELKRRRWTKLELAKRAGMSAGYLGDILKGRTNGTEVTREKIASALGVDYFSLSRISSEQAVGAPHSQTIGEAYGPTGTDILANLFGPEANGDSPFSMVEVVGEDPFIMIPAAILPGGKRPPGRFYGIRLERAITHQLLAGAILVVDTYNKSCIHGDLAVIRKNDECSIAQAKKYGDKWYLRDLSGQLPDKPLAANKISGKVVACLLPMVALDRA